jgi:hypothetical protein
MKLKMLPLLSVLAVSGCAASSNPNYFPVREQRFDLQADGTGNLTHVEIKTSDPLIVNGHSFDSLGGVDMRFTKDADYQMPETGTPNATMDYVMKPSLDGQWTGIRSIVSWQNPGYPTTTVLIEFNNRDHVSKMIIPPPGSPAGTYYGYGSDSYGGYTPDGFVPQHVQFPLVLWVAKISYSAVKTPFYEGVALSNEIRECAMPISLDDIDDPLKCSIETWSFAPNIGLVEVDTKWVPLPCAPYCPAGTQVPPLPPSLRRIN